MTFLFTLLTVVISVGGVIATLPPSKNRRKLIALFLALGAISTLLLVEWSIWTRIWSFSALVWRSTTDVALAFYASSAFWVFVCAICVVAGMAIQRWLIPIDRPVQTQIIAGTVRSAIDYAEKWVPPKEAIDLFVQPEVLGKARSALEEASTLRAALASAATPTPQQLVEQCEAMEELAKRRMSDVMSDLYGQFKGDHSRLVAKGYKRLKSGEFERRETILPSSCWGIRWESREILDIETGMLAGPFDTVYRDVMIGERTGQ